MKDYNHRILVVDDNRAIHDDFRKILNGTQGPSSVLADLEAALFATRSPSTCGIHFEIDSAFQGQEGLALVKRAVEAGEPYATAFVDVRMPPGWDGIETTARIWEVDPDLQIVICMAFSDYSWAEMTNKLGHSNQLLILKKPFDKIEALQMAHALTEKWSLAREIHRHLQELERTVQARTQALSTANERLEIELAERGQAEQQIREQAALLDRAPSAILVRGIDERIRYWNQGAERLYGWSAGEAIGRDASELLQTEDAPPLQEAQEQVMVQDEWIGELNQRTKDGKAVVVESRWTLLCDNAGRPQARLIINTDVTVRKQLEEQLRQSQKMEAIGQLAGGVAHDFNNLLTVIQGHAALMLNSERLPSELAGDAQQITFAAERAASLTRQLLTYSRRQVMQLRNLDLNEVVANMTRMLQRILGEDIALSVQYAPLLPPVYADPGMVEQTLLNLVVNSRDAMPRGGQLLIITGTVDINAASLQENPDAKAGPAVFLSVRDTGCGIAPENLSHIFEPFFTTKEVGKGTGLGLATVYAVVKQHDGWIRVHSELGYGTTFRIHLPAAHPAPSIEERTPSAELVRGGTETVLLVEDETPLRNLVRTILERHGYRILEAGTGVEALQVWQEHRESIDVLLTDMVMPDGLTGHELAERVRAERPDLKLIYSSGYSHEVLRQDVILREGINFLQKPYAPRKLLQTVRDCLERRND